MGEEYHFAADFSQSVEIPILGSILAGNQDFRSLQISHAFMTAEPLTSSQIRKLSNAIPVIYGAGNISALTQLSVELLKQFITSDVVHYTSEDPVGGFRFLASSHQEAQVNFVKALPVLIDHRERHPHITNGVLDLAKARQVRRLSETLDSKYSDACGYTSLFSKANFCENQLYYIFSLGPKLVLMTCNRNDRDYNETEKAIFEFFSPHLECAYRNVALRQQQQDRLERAQATLSAIESESIWVTSNFGLYEHSPRALLLLSEFIAPVHSGLPEVITDWMKAHFDGDQFNLQPPLAIRTATASLICHFHAYQSESLHLITLKRRNHQPSLEAVATLGLSPRRAQVLTWLAQGKTNAQIASILEISKRTVDNHIEAIFDKLGVDSRAGVIVLLSELMA